jgi:hypothetical protein
LSTALVQAALEVQVDVRRPQPLPDLFARDELTRLLQQRAEDLERLLLDRDPPALPSKLAGREIDLEDAEAHDDNDAGGRRGLAV